MFQHKRTLDEFRARVVVVVAAVELLCCCRALSLKHTLQLAGIDRCLQKNRIGLLATAGDNGNAA